MESKTEMAVCAARSILERHDQSSSKGAKVEIDPETLGALVEGVVGLRKAATLYRELWEETKRAWQGSKFGI